MCLCALCVQGSCTYPEAKGFHREPQRGLQPELCGRRAPGCTRRKESHVHAGLGRAERNPEDAVYFRNYDTSGV